MTHQPLHIGQYMAVNEDPTAELFLLKAFQILHIDRVRSRIN